MKRLLGDDAPFVVVFWVALLLVGGIAGAFAQTTPAPAPGLLLWDYADADVAAGQVSLFSVCLDKSPCIHVTIADAKSATAGSFQWKFPPLLVGPHTVSVQACNEVTCSEASTLAFAVSITPTKVLNLRAGAPALRLP